VVVSFIGGGNRRTFHFISPNKAMNLSPFNSLPLHFLIFFASALSGGRKSVAFVLLREIFNDVGLKKLM
jgi:hypothetical protein